MVMQVPDGAAALWDFHHNQMLTRQQVAVDVFVR
jgi:hypothetical protein